MSNDSTLGADDPTLDMPPLTEELAEAVLLQQERDTIPCLPPIEDLTFDLDLDPEGGDESLVA
jgi:hypothetical protein